MGRTSIVACLISAALVAACSNADRPIIVGSKNFTEQVLIGEIIAQHLERRLGRTVQRKLNLGGTMLAHNALLSGGIDLYPEYTGTALTAVLKLPAEADAMNVLERVEAEYRRQYNLQWFAPLGFNNTFAMVVRRADADRHGLATLSDASHYPSGWTLGVGYEFQQRPDGLNALLSTYQLPLTGPPKTMDLGLLYRALEQGHVTMVAGNSTDGFLSVLDVTVLHDDRGCFPPYEAAIVARKETLARVSGLEDALNELSGTLPDDRMRRLNHEASVRGSRIEDVATQFLKDTGLWR